MTSPSLTRHIRSATRLPTEAPLRGIDLLPCQVVFSACRGLSQPSELLQNDVSLCLLCRILESLDFLISLNREVDTFKTLSTKKKR